MRRNIALVRFSFSFDASGSDEHKGCLIWSRNEQKRANSF